MIKVAITGSIGMGKSTVAAMFAARRNPDVRCRCRSAPPAGPGRRAGRAQSTALSRKAFATAGRPRSARQLVLGNPDALAKLEAIVHPAVRAARDRFIAAKRDAPTLLFDIPLLFETGGEASSTR